MVEILPGVHKIEGVNANSYLIVEDDGLTLIDAGMSKDGKKILNFIEASLSRKPSDVKTIVLTHSHLDHVRGAFAIKQATGAKVAIHAEDAEYLSGRKVAEPKGAMGLLFKILGPFFKFTPFEPDLKLNENDKIGALTVIHTPGHTPGSISLYDQSRKMIFVGDAVLTRNAKLQGPPRMFTMDLKQANDSIAKISGFDFDVLLSGHGEPLKSPDAPKLVKELSELLQKGA